MSAKKIKYISIIEKLGLEILKELEEFEISGETLDSKTPITVVKEFLSDCCNYDLEDCFRVSQGKLACERMIERAKRARENGGYDFAAYLQNSAKILSKPISILLPIMEQDDALDC